MYVKSVTSGNRLYGEVIRESRVRKWFLMPSVFVEYMAKGLKGDTLYTAWFYKSEIYDVFK